MPNIMKQFFAHLDITIFALFLTAIANAFALFYTFEPKHKKPAWIILASTLFSAMLGLWFSYSQSVEQERLLSIMTGGNSYAYMNYAFPVGTDNLISQWLENAGEYPLYDLSLQTVDTNLLNKSIIENRAESFMPSYTSVRTVGNLGGRQIAMFEPMSTDPSSDSQFYRTVITARNGSNTQIARFRRVAGRWKVATQLFVGMGEPKEILHRKVQPGFPTDEHGEPLW